MSISIDFADDKQAIKELPENHKPVNTVAKNVAGTWAFMVNLGLRAAEITLYVYVLLTCGFIACFVTIVMLTFLKVLGLAWLFKLILLPSKK
jgi:hypothetical protein